MRLPSRCCQGAVIWTHDQSCKIGIHGGSPTWLTVWCWLLDTQVQHHMVITIVLHHCPHNIASGFCRAFIQETAQWKLDCPLWESCEFPFCHLHNILQAIPTQQRRGSKRGMSIRRLEGETQQEKSWRLSSIVFFFYWNINCSDLHILTNNSSLDFKVQIHLKIDFYQEGSRKWGLQF